MPDAGELTWQEAVMAWGADDERSTAARPPKILGVDGSAPILKVAGGWAIFATALVLGLAGDLLLRATPWGLNITVWLIGLMRGDAGAAADRAAELCRGRGARCGWARRSASR